MRGAVGAHRTMDMQNAINNKVRPEAWAVRSCSSQRISASSLQRSTGQGFTPSGQGLKSHTETEKTHPLILHSYNLTHRPERHTHVYSCLSYLQPLYLGQPQGSNNCTGWPDAPWASFQGLQALPEPGIAWITGHYWSMATALMPGTLGWSRLGTQAE